MPRNYSYQYETSPRKIRPEYTRQTKNKPKYNTTKKVQSKTQNIKKKELQKSSNQNKNIKQEKGKNTVKIKVSIFMKAVLICAIFFLIIFRNSQISQSFSMIQTLKTSITELEKENNQLEINIQNSLNLNHIEQSAKELLGMQKRTNKQTTYISLPKKDYVEPRTEEIIIEEEKSIVGDERRSR